MPLLDNQNSEFKTQLHENSVIDLTQNFYPGSPERQVLESNREPQDSYHERQKVKHTENKNNSRKWKYTTDQRLKLLRTQLEGIPLKNVFRWKQNNKNRKLK